MGEHSSARRRSDVSELTRLLSQTGTLTDCQQHDSSDVDTSGTQSLPIPIPRPLAAQHATVDTGLSGGSRDQAISTMFARPSASGVMQSVQCSPYQGVCQAQVCASHVSGPDPPWFLPASAAIGEPVAAQSVADAGRLPAGCPMNEECSFIMWECRSHLPQVCRVPQRSKANRASQKIEAAPDTDSVDYGIAQPGPWGSDYSPFGSSPVFIPHHQMSVNVDIRDVVLHSSAAPVVPGTCGSCVDPPTAASGLSGALFSLDEDLPEALHAPAYASSMKRPATNEVHSQVMAAGGSTITVDPSSGNHLPAVRGLRPALCLNASLSRGLPHRDLRIQLASWLQMTMTLMTARLKGIADAIEGVVGSLECTQAPGLAIHVNCNNGACGCDSHERSPGTGRMHQHEAGTGWMPPSEDVSNEGVAIAAFLQSAFSASDEVVEAVLAASQSPGCSHGNGAHA